MPGGKRNVYGPGQGGVNVDADPTKLRDDEARRLQNWILDTDAAQGGLRKRGGLPRFNSVALGASALGGISVPLPNPVGGLVRTYYAGLGTAASNTWATSANGTSWALGSTPTDRAQRASKRIVGTSDNTNVRGVSPYRSNFWYATDNYTLGTTNPYLVYNNGTLTYTIGEIPLGSQGGVCNYVTHLCLHEGELYIAVEDNGGAAPNHRGRVFHVDVGTGALTQIGQAFSNQAGELAGGYPYALCSFMGQLFVSLYGVAAAQPGMIYRIRPFAETAWTADSLVLANYVVSMAVFKGNLYLGGIEDVGVNGFILKRTPSGVYTSVHTGAGVAALNGFSNLIVFDGALYAHYYEELTISKIYRSTDGTTWTEDLDLFTVFGSPGEFRRGGSMVVDGVLYLSAIDGGDTGVNGRILRRSGGVWTSVFTGNLTGWLGVVEVQS